MFSSPALKTTAIAATLIVAGASAQATTVASVELTNGTYEIGASLGSPIPFPVGPALQITADFDAGFMPFDLGQQRDFILAAGLTIDGDELFDAAVTVEDLTGFDLIDDALSLIGSLPPELLAILGNALSEILDNDSTPSEIDDDLFLNFEYDVTGGDATSVQGSFVATLSTTATSFFAGGPFSPSGTFSGYASISAVPLPASSLVLLSGMAGFAALRRKKMAQKA